MQLTPLLAYLRSIQLKRELSRLERKMDELAPHQREKLALAMIREYEAAQQCPWPHLYQTEAKDIRYRPWGEGTRIACRRLESGNPEIRLRAMALWLAVAFHETVGSAYSSTQAVHRRIIRISRDLRQLASDPEGERLHYA